MHPSHMWSRGKTAAIVALSILCSPAGINGESFSHYRGFELGSGIGMVAAAIGVASSEATTIHARPAVLQDLAGDRLPVVLIIRTAVAVLRQSG